MEGPARGAMAQIYCDSQGPRERGSAPTTLGKTIATEFGKLLSPENNGARAARRVLMLLNFSPDLFQGLLCQSVIGAELKGLFEMLARLSQGFLRQVSAA